MRLKPVLAVFCLMATLAALPSFLSGQEEAKRKVLSRIAPSYPEIARRMQISGTVRLQVEIQPNGTPGATKILGGHPMLAQAALDAVNKWKWAPGTENTTEVIEINFNQQK